ncbi:MAG: sigma-70 family RNA polymerase sigma factor, partial [Rhodospirillales bacterium]|nr:sigma-70 family RNA polymerase sigma factor [Rhodospirillales bacterium]
EGGGEWQDWLEDPGESHESDILEANELDHRRQLFADSLEVLTDREQHILAERRLKEEPSTLEELSQVYGVSRERIRQIEERAFKKLQKAMRTAHRKQREEAASAALP